MRRGRIFLLLALIIVIGIALVFLIYNKGMIFPGSSGANETDNAAVLTSTPIPTSKVVVVAQRVPRGETITADKLDLVDYQADLVLPIIFADVSQVSGKMARYTMEPYAVITSALLTDTPDPDQRSDDAL